MKQTTERALFCQKIIATSTAIERFQRHLFLPQASDNYLSPLLRCKSQLSEARTNCGAAASTPEDAQAHEALERGSLLLEDAIARLANLQRDDYQTVLRNILRSARKYCQAQEVLFSAISRVQRINCFFYEPQCRLREKDACPSPPPDDAPPVFIHSGEKESPYSRGAFSLFIPDDYSPDTSWPLVIALHGGFGHGRDFIWTWVREARSRGFLLLAPSSKGATWSLSNPKTDGAGICDILDSVRQKWRVDENHILVTGVSDGATFSLLCALEKDTPFTAYAPIAGTLPPASLDFASGRKIYWTHGALDWMFPATRARQFANILRQAGAEIQFQLIESLSHTYPREANQSILAWFDKR